MPGDDLYAHERFMASITEQRWGLQEETETGVADVAVEEAEEVRDVESHPVLSSQGDQRSSVAVGGSGRDELLENMRELEQLMREAGRNMDEHDEMCRMAQKALYRCVDQLKGFNNEYR